MTGTYPEEPLSPEWEAALRAARDAALRDIREAVDGLDRYHGGSGVHPDDVPAGFVAHWLTHGGDPGEDGDDPLDDGSADELLKGVRESIERQRGGRG